LPTHLYIAGGAITVAVSFALTTRASPRVVARARSLRLALPVPIPDAPRLETAASLLSLAVAGVLVAAGLAGSRDPLANPLPLFVWTVWWIGLTYLHAAAGNLWTVLNPWSGLLRLLTGLAPLRRWPDAPPLSYPRWAAEWPAVAGLLLFAWFELIHPAPTDPAILAGVVAGYWLAHLAGGLLFGPPWLGRAETFTVFFRMISWVAPIAWRGPSRRLNERDAHAGLALRLPALRLLEVAPLGPSGVAFVLLVLAAVSFDGLSRTFAWLGLLGVNPLVHPGRTVLIPPNTLGLLATFAVLGLAYLVAVRLAGAGPGVSGQGRPAVFALSLIPIACGYHFAHYLPVLLVDVQYALRAASDPFARDWDLFSTRDLHVVTSFLSDPSRVYAIWHTQVALIVAAHVASVVVAHGLAQRLDAPARARQRGQLALLVLMIGYTMLGLWLLSTPAAG
jgi:hypothetical protein